MILSKVLLATFLKYCGKGRLPGQVRFPYHTQSHLQHTPFRNYFSFAGFWWRFDRLRWSANSSIGRAQDSCILARGAALFREPRIAGSTPARAILNFSGHSSMGERLVLWLRGCGPIIRRCRFESYCLQLVLYKLNMPQGESDFLLGGGKTFLVRLFFLPVCR